MKDINEIYTAQLIKQLITCDNDADALDLAKILVDRAKQGDLTAAKFILEKLYGKP